jgi:hypothetical protein
MSTRAHFLKTLVDSQGNVQPGCVVKVLVPLSATPISGTLWTDNTTTTSSLTNPFVTSDGVVSFYLDTPQRVRLSVTPPGGTEVFFEDLDVILQPIAITTVTDGTTPVSTETKVKFVGQNGIAVLTDDDTAGLQARVIIDGSGISQTLVLDANGTLYSATAGATVPFGPTNSVVIGKNAADNGTASAVVIGNGATSGSTNTVAVGEAASAAAATSTAVGPAASAASAYSTAVGNASIGTTADAAVAIGKLANVVNAATNSVAVGATAKAWEPYAVAVGFAAAAHDSSVAVGKNSIADDSSVAVGVSASANVADAVAVGPSTTASQSGATAVGWTANAGGTDATALGFSAYASGTDATAVGKSADAEGADSTALGSNTVVTHANSTAVGTGATTTAANQIMVGRSTETTVVPGALAVKKEAVNTVAASGAAATLPAGDTAMLHHVTLTANCTLTFPTAAAGASFSLFLKQDGTGSRTVTWPGTAKWAGGTVPTLTTTAAKTDAFSFVCPDGTNWFGFVSGQNF